VPEEAKIMQEEPFVPIAPFENFDEVIMRANSLPYGLANYVFTRSPAIVTRASEALDVGTVGVNDLLLATAEMPFGGVRSSGTGREGGRLGIFDYLDAKHTKLKFA
jgi:succinate-semialdehyde dehydrogenase/glutarate-semialdehyde dehydrogenase